MASRSKITAFAAVLATGIILVFGAASSQAKDNGTASVVSVQTNVLNDSGDIGIAHDADGREQPRLDCGDIGAVQEADHPDHDGGDVGIVQDADGRDSLDGGDVGTAPDGRN